MKDNFIFVLIVSILLINSCSFNNDEKLPDRAKKDEQKYLCFNESLGDNNIADICFEINKDPILQHTYYNNIIIKIDNNKYSLQLNTMEYDRESLEIIQYFGEKIGNWNGHYYAYDLNKNGIKELIFFSLLGMGMEISIYEYRDYGFVEVFNYLDKSLSSRISIMPEKKAIVVKEIDRMRYYIWDNTDKLYKEIQ